MSLLFARKKEVRFCTFSFPTDSCQHCHSICDQSWGTQCRTLRYYPVYKLTSIVKHPRQTTESAGLLLIPCKRQFKCQNDYKCMQLMFRKKQLKFIFCVQVYRQVKTDKCAEVTQQTQCLSLEYKRKKRKDPTVEPTWVRNNTCFFFVTFQHFFLHFLKFLWICTNYGIKFKKKKKAKEREIWGAGSKKIITIKRHHDLLHTHSHARSLANKKKIWEARKTRHNTLSKSRDGQRFCLSLVARHGRLRVPNEPRWSRQQHTALSTSRSLCAVNKKSRTKKCYSLRGTLSLFASRSIINAMIENEGHIAHRRKPQKEGQGLVKIRPKEQNPR